MSAVVLVLLTLLAPAAKPQKPAAPAPAAEGKAAAPPVQVIDGAGALDEPRKVAEAYLRALEGKGDDTARSYLLGGATLTARDFTIPNWRIKSRDAARVEDKDVAGAVSAMRALEKKGAEALTNVVLSEDSQVAMNQEQANKLLEPTRIQAQKFIEAYPLFAYVARVGKDVFWHPDNPWLQEAKKLGTAGKYQLEVHRFTIEEREEGAPARVWPLRVLRIRSNGYDSGWKILPASDWDPNY